MYTARVMLPHPRAMLPHPGVMLLHPQGHVFPEVMLSHPHGNIPPQVMLPHPQGDVFPEAMLSHPQGDAPPFPGPVDATQALLPAGHVPSHHPGWLTEQDGMPTHPVPVPAPSAMTQQNQPLFLPKLGQLPAWAACGPSPGGTPSIAVGTPLPQQMRLFPLSQRALGCRGCSKEPGGSITPLCG